jgi:serine protease Do
MEYAYLGLTGTTLTPDLAAAMNVDDTLRGVLVVDVAAKGPAEKAGVVGGDQQVSIDGQTAIVGGDILTAIDGQALTSMDDLISYLANYTIVGQTVKLTVIKDGKEKSLEATLIARPSTVEEVSTQETQATQEPQTNSSSSVKMGVAVTTMTPSIASAMGLPEDQKGVLILEIEQGSPANSAGLIGGYTPVIINSKRVMIGGDVITALDAQAISSVDDLQQFLSEKQPGDVIELTILRGGNEQKVTLTLVENTSN